MAVPRAARWAVESSVVLPDQLFRRYSLVVVAAVVVRAVVPQAVVLEGKEDAPAEAVAEAAPVPADSVRGPEAVVMVVAAALAEAGQIHLEQGLLAAVEVVRTPADHPRAVRSPTGQLGRIFAREPRIQRDQRTSVRVRICRTILWWTNRCPTRETRMRVLKHRRI